MKRLIALLLLISFGIFCKVPEPVDPGQDEVVIQAEDMELFGPAVYVEDTQVVFYSQGTAFIDSIDIKPGKAMVYIKCYQQKAGNENVLMRLFYPGGVYDSIEVANVAGELPNGVQIPVNVEDGNGAFGIEYLNNIDNRRLYFDWMIVEHDTTDPGLALLVSWDPNTEEDLAGYKVFYGESPGQYSHTVNVGNVTEHLVKDLEYNTDYYFAVTAYDNANNESNFSQEVAAKTKEEDVRRSYETLRPIQ